MEWEDADEMFAAARAVALSCKGQFVEMDNKALLERARELLGSMKRSSVKMLVILNSVEHGLKHALGDWGIAETKAAGASSERIKQLETDLRSNEETERGNRIRGGRIGEGLERKRGRGCDTPRASPRLIVNLSIELSAHSKALNASKYSRK